MQGSNYLLYHVTIHYLNLKPQYSHIIKVQVEKFLSCETNIEFIYKPLHEILS